MQVLAGCNSNSLSPLPPIGYPLPPPRPTPTPTPTSPSPAHNDRVFGQVLSELTVMCSLLNVFPRYFMLEQLSGSDAQLGRCAAGLKVADVCDLIFIFCVDVLENLRDSSPAFR